MQKPVLSLQPSEAVVVQAASHIYAAYIIAGRVPEGQTELWMQRALQEAYHLAKMADDAIQSDSELG